MIIQKLPFKNRDIETIALLRFAAQAQGNLGKVNGIARNIPNQNILLSFINLLLQYQILSSMLGHSFPLL